MKEISNDQEFAEQYKDLCEVMCNDMSRLYNIDEEEYLRGIPTINTILDLIVQRKTKKLQHELHNMLDFLFSKMGDSAYDAEYLGHCINECNRLLDYLEG